MKNNLHQGYYRRATAHYEARTKWVTLVEIHRRVSCFSPQVYQIIIKVRIKIMEINLLDAGSLMAIVMGVVQVIKQLKINDRFIPVLALLVGIGASVLFFGITGGAVLQGLVMGLATMGLWSGTRKTVNG